MAGRHGAMRACVGACLTLVVMASAVAAFSTHVGQDDCQQVSLRVSEALDTSLPCLPQGSMQDTLQALQDVLVVNMDSNNVLNIAMFGTPESGLHRFPQLLLRAMADTHTGRMVANISIDRLNQDTDDDLHRQLLDAGAKMERRCARGVVTLMHMEGVTSAHTLNALLGPTDGGRPHVKSRSGGRDASTANGVFFLLFDMRGVGDDGAWSQPGWDWRNWVDNRWSTFDAYTRGTLTGRLHAGVVLPLVSDAEAREWRRLQDATHCGAADFKPFEVKPIHILLACAAALAIPLVTCMRPKAPTRQPAPTRAASPPQRQQRQQRQFHQPQSTRLHAQPTRRHHAANGAFSTQPQYQHYQ